ncbi:MAG TPA: hypothetical protein VFM09_06195 [Marmoricola sp.]|nr:hypothetical protein [Marmoricola sp.]
MSDVQQKARATGSATVPEQRGHRSEPEPPAPTGWAGVAAFGGFMLMILGVFQAIIGLVALLQESYYLVGSQGLVVHVDYAAWGWVHLALAAIAIPTGYGLLKGATWARIIGVGVAVLSAIVNFAFIAAFPIWSVMIITIDVLVIYAIAAHGRELQH